MRTVIVFFAFITVSFAGVLKWSPEAEQEFTDLYRKYCSGPSDNGKDGNTDWFCKKSKYPIIREPLVVQKELEISAPQQTEQLVFVHTPSDEYTHQIFINGKANVNHRTKVVVVPGVDTHNYDIKGDIDVNIDGAKPAIFYLKNNPEENTPPKTVY